ncbi:MAG: hypothetical protein RIU46_38985 [Deltaproteobacteria bacterium]|jgi:hypothetical protein
MQLQELERHLERVDRSLARAQKRTGDGYSYSADLGDGSRIRYKLNGVPPIEEVEDHVRHALIDLWSLRDYVLHTLRAQGADTQPVWNRVKNRRYLTLGADLANLAKHGVLTRWHWMCPVQFGTSKYCAEMRRDYNTGRLIGSGIQQLTRRVGEVEINFMNQSDPEWFSYELPVLDSDGDQVDEACNVLANFYAEWNALRYGYRMAR